MNNNNRREITVTVNQGYKGRTEKPAEAPAEKPAEKLVNAAEPKAAAPEKRSKKGIGLRIAAVLVTAEAIVIICLGSKLSGYKELYNKDEEYIKAQASRVFEYMGEKDKVSLDDPTYGDIWLQALTDYPMNIYDWNNIRIENGLKAYYTGDKKITTAGIDVSYYQGSIDWDAVKASGIDYVMLRVGYRGYETGKISIDENFHRYAADAEAAGLAVGVYFFSQALTEAEAIEEAEAVLAEIDGYNVTYPVAFDWEVIGESTARTAEISAEALTDCAYAFCNRVAEDGYIPMIYSTNKMALMKYDLSKLAGFDFWLAQYRDEPTFPYEMQMWQYASDGSIDGIEGEVDLNMSFIDYSQVRQNHVSRESEETEETE
ncbi:MAG: GH25 family lysozyme [Huintestinicola sp.]